MNHLAGKRNLQDTSLSIRPELTDSVSTVLTQYQPRVVADVLDVQDTHKPATGQRLGVLALTLERHGRLHLSILSSNSTGEHNLVNPIDPTM